MAQGSTFLTSLRAPSAYAGNPPPEVIWFHNGSEIQESEDFHFEQRGTWHSLCIQEVFPEDTGTYTCEAWNSAGEGRTQAVLMVQGAAAGPAGVEAGRGGRQVLPLWSLQRQFGGQETTCACFISPAVPWAHSSPRGRLPTFVSGSGRGNPLFPAF